METTNRYYKKSFLITLLILSLVLFVSAKIEIKWLFEWYDLQDKDTEKLINLRIENGWSFGGIDFDGFQFAIFFTKYNPFVKNSKITNWNLFNTTLNEKEINSLYTKKIKEGFIPLGISVYEGTLSTFFVNLDKPIFLISYKLGIYKDDENSNISTIIENEINKDYIPVGFSYDKEQYYILYLKIKGHSLKDKIWGIDWVANNSYNLKNYIKQLYDKGLKITDFDIKNDTIGFFWTEDY